MSSTKTRIGLFIILAAMLAITGTALCSDAQKTGFLCMHSNDIRIFLQQLSRTLF